MSEDGPDRYCPVCGWFPEDSDEEDYSPVDCVCPSCGLGSMKAISEDEL